MEEREPGKYVKVVGDDGGVPMDFAFWIQLQEVSAADTRLRLVLRIDLNMMMKMMMRQQAAGGAGSDRRGDRPGDERRPAGLNGRQTKSGTAPANRARLRRHDAPGNDSGRGGMFAAQAWEHAAKGGMTPYRRLRQGSRKHSSARRAHEKPNKRTRL